MSPAPCACRPLGDKGGSRLGAGASASDKWSGSRLRVSTGERFHGLKSDLDGPDLAGLGLALAGTSLRKHLTAGDGAAANRLNGVLLSACLTGNRARPSSSSPGTRLRMSGNAFLNCGAERQDGVSWPILLTVKEYAALPPCRHPQCKAATAIQAADCRLAFAGFLLSGRQLDSADRFGCQSHRLACRVDCGWLETILGRCSRRQMKHVAPGLLGRFMCAGRKLKHAQTGDSLSHEHINANR
jgi:hypothetical protein